jgi:ABC-2 type transport system ATP-binding protein
MISLKCSNPRLVASRFVQEISVLKMSFGADGRSLVVETHSRDAFFTRLQSVFLEDGVEVDEITSPDDNLQAVFDYLVGK